MPSPTSTESKSRRTQNNFPFQVTFLLFFDVNFRFFKLFVFKWKNHLNRLARYSGLLEGVPEDCALLDSDTPQKPPKLIDVRGRDFKGGHVPGSHQMRTSSVLECPGVRFNFLRLRFRFQNYATGQNILRTSK